MQIDHIAVFTKNLEKSREFYIKYFSGESNEKYRNPRTGLETYFISFKGGCRLELMQKPDLKASEIRDKVLGLTHLAFSTGSREKVDQLTQRLFQDGYTIHSAPRVSGDGYYESSILDPDNNIIEIIA